jgi:micrococcal nuclease|tara:strand:- start:69 stop:557 length:489 start_codon:yes stop_codon:yes gene_type:complete
MYEYRCTVLKVVDGDTVDVDIDLGFGIVLTDERVRLMGIDTPESRTSDKVEDLFGELAKARLKEMVSGRSGPILKTQINKKGEDMKGKFGRILGDFEVEKNGERRMATDVLIEEGHAVAYFGGSKEEISAKHLVNRDKLLREGLVSQEDFDKATAIMEKKNS